MTDDIASIDEEPLRFVVAVDNGSQSTKVLVVDQFGRVHAAAQRPLLPTESGAGGRVVHPGDDVWDSIAEACHSVLADFAGDTADIVGIGLCTIRFCRALLGHDDRLAEPLLSWMDARVARPHNADPRVRWVTTSSGYVTLRLTGEHRDAAANQQGMWPIDQVTWSWSEDADDYRRTGIRPDQLFELVEPGGLLGTVTADAARATGLPEGLPVYATANDKAVEALGAGIRGEDVLLSLGTYIAAMTIGDRPFPASDAYWVNFGAQPGCYLYESNGIRRGMWTVSWWRQLFDGDVRMTDDALNRDAALVQPGSRGLFVALDWLAPNHAPHRRGALLGFDGSQGRPEVYRAILEGIALTMRKHLDSMEAALDRTGADIVLTGGGSRSDLMAAIVAAVFERPVRRVEVTDAAGIGAAICALVGAKIHPNWEAAVEATVRTRSRTEPDPQWCITYRSIAARHSIVRDRLDLLFQDIASH